MKNELDEKVQKLYSIIQNKKAKIAKLEKPNYKTNLSFPYNEFSDTQKVNLHVINDIPTLIKLLANLSILKKEYDLICDDINIDNKFIYGGYSYEDWENDIVSIINKLNIKKEKDDLANKEKKLNCLISPEEKRRLDIEALESELLPN